MALQAVPFRAQGTEAQAEMKAAWQMARPGILVPIKHFKNTK